MAKEKKKKGKKKRNVRTHAQRISDLEKKLAEEKSKASLNSIKSAVKDGRVDDDNKAEFRDVLSQFKGINKAGSVLRSFDKDAEAKVCDKLSAKLVSKLESLMTDPSDESEEEEETEEEEEETEEEEDEEEDEDEEDDDDDDDDDEDDDDEEDDDD